MNLPIAKGASLKVEHLQSPSIGRCLNERGQIFLGFADSPYLMLQVFERAKCSSFAKRTSLKVFAFCMQPRAASKLGDVLHSGRFS